MTRYLLFRNASNNLQYQGYTDAEKPSKAIQKWLDQSVNPPEISKADKLNQSEYIAVAASNTHGYVSQKKVK